MPLSPWKIFLAAAITLWGVWLAVPNFLPHGKEPPSWLPSNTLNLGLDLRGGSHLLLEVDWKAYMHEQFTFHEDRVRQILRENKAGYRDLTATEEDISFSLRNEADHSRVLNLLQEEISELKFRTDGSTLTGTLPDWHRQRMTQQLIEQSIEIIRRRVDETGTREPIIQRQGEYRILLQVPGLDDPEKLKGLLGQTAKLTFHLVREAGGSDTIRLAEETRPGAPPSFISIEKKPMLSGEALVDANATYQDGQPVVSFRFNSSGARTFGDITTRHTGQRFAIVLDNHIISAPVIREPIRGGEGIISGSFTIESAQDLALLLRAGALPAPLTVMEERTVGPSLGADSIAAGKSAALLAVCLVMGFMLLSYGLFGLFSNLSLIVNIILLTGLLSLFQATLTLPGIAGIVLTMGIAVDANVLIFERIREEMETGKRAITAIESGFSRALETILDSNITTLIAAFLLFFFGSGPVRGFAVTLSLGILTSMFSAILLTRVQVLLWWQRKRPAALPL